jgi:hypothetical protein
MDVSHRQEKPPLGRRFLVYGVVFFAIILTGTGFLHYLQGTPRYSLYQMGKAIRDHDSERFGTFLDIDKIVDGLVKSTVKEVEDNVSQHEPSGSPSQDEKIARRERDLVTTLMPQVAKALKPILKKQIHIAVEQIGRKNNVSPLGICILSEVEKKGEVAEVRVKAGKKKIYHFTMERTPQRLWKVVNIDINILDFARKAFPPAGG